MARVADERALPLIPLPHRLFHTRRDVPWIGADVGARRTGPPARAEPAALQLAHERGESARVNLLRVPSSNRVAQQRLRILEVVLCALAEAHVVLIAMEGNWRDPRHDRGRAVRCRIFTNSLRSELRVWIQRYGHWPDQRQGLGTRKAGSQQLFDLALAPPGGSGEKLACVLACQMAGQQQNAG